MSVRYRDNLRSVPVYIEACQLGGEYTGPNDGRWNARARNLLLKRGLMLVPFAGPFIVPGPDLPMIAPQPCPGSDEPWPQSLMVWQDDDTIYSNAQDDREKWVWQV